MVEGKSYFGRDVEGRNKVRGVVLSREKKNEQGLVEGQNHHHHSNTQQQQQPPPTMNQHECPFGWATDEIFLCPDIRPINSTLPLQPCDAPLFAYIGLASVILAARIGINIKQTQVWLERERALARIVTHRRRFPIVVLMGILTVLILTLFIVLSSMDIVKCSNGSSGVMLFLLFAPVIMQGILFIRRIVTLGRRAIPLAKRHLLMSEAQELQLSKLDGVLTGFTIVGSICMVIAPVALLIHPAFPGSFIPLAVAMSAFGILDIALATGLAYHIERLLQLMTSIALESSTTRAREKAKSILQNQQIFLIVTGSVYGIYWILLASRAIPFAWWATIILLTFETQIAFFFLSRFGGAQRPEGTTPSHTGGPSPPVTPAHKDELNNGFFGILMNGGTSRNKNAEDEIFTIMDDGQVSDVEGATISVVQHETVEVDANDTFVPKAAEKSLYVSQYLAHRTISFVFTFLASGLLSALLAVALATDQIAAAIVFLIVVTLGCLALFLTTLSKKVLVELWHTDFLRFRIVVTLLGTGLLTDSLGGTSDARSMLAPALGMLQLLAFCTDALVTPLFRSSILWCAHHTTFITWVFIFWDLVPNMNNTVVPIGSGYSLLQASRDILLAQWSLFVVEARFVSRGRDHKRFLHVTRPVEKVLLSREETQSRETVRQHKYTGNASSVMMQSGFVIRQTLVASLHDAQENRTIAMVGVAEGEVPVPHKARVRVYVNKVAVKQASAILFAVFGFEENAIAVYSYLDGLTGRVMHATALLFPLVTAILLPFVPKPISYPLCWACIPCTVIISLRQLSLLSTTMTKLLVARVTFLPVVGLMLGWMILMCIILGDARCAVATFGALTYVWCDVLGDASTATPAMYRIGRVLTTMGSSPTVLVLSVYFLADQFVDVANVDWSVKVLGETNSTQSNAPEVIDASQLVGDFGFFSIAIPAILQAIQVVWAFFQGSDGKMNFKSIAAPVMPNYMQGDAAVSPATLTPTNATPTNLPFAADRPASTAVSQSSPNKRPPDKFIKRLSVVVRQMEGIPDVIVEEEENATTTAAEIDPGPEIIW